MDKKIQVGDEVVRNDGAVGKVIAAEMETYRHNAEFKHLKITIEYETGEKTKVDTEQTYFRLAFYSIGDNFYGNLLSEEDMQKRIANQQALCDKENARLEQLHKQYSRYFGKDKK